MRKPLIAIKLRPQNYPGLVSLGNRVFTGLSGNTNFPAPGVPLVTLHSAVVAVTDAYARWAPVGGHGSTADLLDLRNKALHLHQLLKAEAQYVQLTAQVAAGSDYTFMAAIIGSSGYGLADTPVPKGVLNPVVGLRQVVTPRYNPNRVLLKWKKPLDTHRANIYAYNVMRGTTTNFDDAEHVATTSRTSFVDNNNTGTVQTYTYWIVPINYMGDGAASVAVTLSVLG